MEALSCLRCGEKPTLSYNKENKKYILSHSCEYPVEFKTERETEAIAVAVWNSKVKEFIFYKWNQEV